MLPLPEGDAVVVNRYCVVKLAINAVAVAGTIIVWLIAPPSLQFANTYRVPLDPACGEVTEIVWLLPCSQLKVSVDE